MLYECDRGSTVDETTKNIHATYGEEAVGSSTCYRWFSKFRSGDANLTDKHRTGRPVEFDDEALQALGKVHKYGQFVLHQLSTANLDQRASSCSSLLFRQKHEPFLDRIVTGDVYHSFYPRTFHKLILTANRDFIS